jgi:ubiquinone/menaquinone biosynthesis C-methylase UbiE
MKEMDTETTQQWYESNAKKYAKNIEDKISMPQIKDFVKLLPKNGKVLDAGCAAGRDVELLTKEGLIVLGIDLSKNLLKIAKQKNPTCSFVYGNFLDLPFPDSSFDGLWSHNSLVHLENKNQVEKAVSEFSRVLKIKGWIHFFVKAQMGEKKTAVKKDAFSGHERYFRYYTKSEVEELLKKNNFKIKSMKQLPETDFLADGRPGEDMIIVLAQKK